VFSVDILFRRSAFRKKCNKFGHKTASIHDSSQIFLIRPCAQPAKILVVLVKEGVIEIQGDHRDVLLEELRKRGWTVKRVGG